jgi:hypothetical protein
LRRRHQSGNAELRVIAEISGVDHNRVYHLFRLPGAPPPVEKIAGIKSYDIAAAVAYVRGEAYVEGTDGPSR